MKNPHYYDHDKVTIEKVKLAYFDGSDQEMTIRNFESGAYSIAGVYPNSSNYAKTKEKYQDNIVYSLQDKTSWYFNFNVNRKTYNHTAKTTDEQKKSAQTAILNKKNSVRLSTLELIEQPTLLNLTVKKQQQNPSVILWFPNICPGGRQDLWRSNSF